MVISVVQDTVAIYIVLLHIHACITGPDLFFCEGGLSHPQGARGHGATPTPRKFSKLYVHLPAICGILNQFLCQADQLFL